MIIQSRRVWIAGLLMPAQIEITEQKITRILPYGSGIPGKDYGDLRILPGFIDIHTHGAYGFDTNDADPDGLRYWMEHIPSEGVTAFLPTTVTQLPEVLIRALKNVAAVAEEGYRGAEILGIHLEGPFLDMKYKGAQPAEAIAVPSIGQFEQYQKAAGGRIRYVTLSSEHDEHFLLTRYCTEHGVVVSNGHSGADFEQAFMAVANGATSMTHVYNGMSPFHHRDPGLTGAALRLHDIYGEVICDGHHVHPAALHLFFQEKGRDYGIMVSDSLQAKYGQAGTRYSLGGQEIEVGPDGLARLSGTDTIAGSTLSISQGLRILIEEAMVPMDAAINSCTINPARCLHVDDRKGKICAGYDADLVVLKKDYSVHTTFCRGQEYRYDGKGDV